MKSYPPHSPGGLSPLMDVLSETCRPPHSPGGLRSLMKVLSEASRPPDSPSGLSPLREVITNTFSPPHSPGSLRLPWRPPSFGGSHIKNLTLLTLLPASDLCGKSYLRSASGLCKQTLMTDDNFSKFSMST